LRSEHHENYDLKSLLHRPPYIPESKNIRDLLEELRAEKRHISVIIDEYGGTSGLVTIEDILEEIVGEIQDEFDENELTFEHKFNEDGSIELEGRLNVDVFNELLDAGLEEDEGFDTLAGFVIDSIGRIPSIGENLELEQFTFTILEADDRRIIKMLVKPMESE
jgi:magnesium and cobalt transporter